MERFLLIFVSLCVGTYAVNDYCQQGFQVATRFYDCWQDAKFRNKYPDLYEKHEFLDAAFLERYATFMCSVVKPQALACFKKEVRDCPNRAKLVVTADESGGACKGKELNPDFKTYVINHLVKVTGDRDSPCFTTGQTAYDKCYLAAGKKVIDSGQSDHIDRFHLVADMFFETYWDCMTDIYKKNADKCPHWQIPMLLVLQKTALPSLFGMHLRPDQVGKLELIKGPNKIIDGNTTIPDEGEAPCKNASEGSGKKMYLLMQILSKKPADTGSSSEGSRLVVELSNLNGDTPMISLEGEDTESDNEVLNFVNILSGPNTENTLKDRRRRRKEERKKSKQLAKITNKLNGKEPSTKKTKKKNSKRRKTNKKTQNDSDDKMIN